MLLLLRPTRYSYSSSLRSSSSAHSLSLSAAAVVSWLCYARRPFLSEAFDQSWHKNHPTSGINESSSYVVAASSRPSTFGDDSSSSKRSSCDSQRREMTTTVGKTWQDSGAVAAKECILPLSEDSHKGSSGRVAVLGGSSRYTGAPYYAAMASLKVGADLAYVFTAQEAALPIKCYSPELMVAPVYSAADFDAAVARQQRSGGSDGTENNNDDVADLLVENMVDLVTPELSRLHCLVIGPGLGRCPLVMKAVARIITAAREQELHMVLDADVLFMLSLPHYRNLLDGYDKVILTPNVVEYKRLFGDDFSDSAASARGFASAVVVKKGKQDVISRGGRQAKDSAMTCEEPGGLKRSGGIGDVLAGTLGTLTAWHAIMNRRRGETESQTTAFSPLELSCWTACCIVKRATRRAFEAKQRSMTAPDVLDELGATLQSMTTDTGHQH